MKRCPWISFGVESRIEKEKREREMTRASTGVNKKHLGGWEGFL
jgi:hypothetical protein